MRIICKQNVFVWKWQAFATTEVFDPVDSLPHKYEIDDQPTDQTTDGHDGLHLQ